MSLSAIKLSKEISTERINDAIAVLHQAAQFIAYAGKHILPQRPDDSNTAMDWFPETSIFAGHLINDTLRVGLNSITLDLLLLDKNLASLDSFSLPGNTHQQGFDWLKKSLDKHNIDSSALSPKLHYEIPKHPISAGKPYNFDDIDALTEAAAQRSLVHYLIDEHKKAHSLNNELLTWPHHFDHGCYIPFRFNDEKSAAQSYSIGYAIEDSLIPETYIYVTQWAIDKKIPYNSAPILSVGEWQPGGLKGAALVLSKIASANNQAEAARTFLKKTTEWSKEI